MNTYEGYLIITDMDGTLLDSSKKISENNREAIWKFIDQGGKFSVATGRSPASASRWLRELPVNYPCIFYNGSMVKDIVSDTVISCTYLEKQKFSELTKWILYQFHDIVVEIFTPQGLYVISDPKFKDPYLEQEKDPYTQGTFSDVAEREWIKILLCGKHETLEKIKNLMDERQIQKYCNCFYSQDFFLEMTPRYSSKGTGLDLIRKYSECRSLKIVALGDYENDEEMLEKADYGVAVGNAIESLKKRADYVTLDHDSNFMEDLLKYLSDKEKIG